MTRDEEKHEYRNSISVSSEASWSAETKNSYWVKRGISISITRRFDDDEPENAATIPEIKKEIQTELENEERAFNRKYFGTDGPFKKDTSPTKKNYGNYGSYNRK